MLPTNANIDLGKTVCDISCAEQIKTMRYCITYILYTVDCLYKRIVKYHYICDEISVSQVQQKREILVLIPI